MTVQPTRDQLRALALREDAKDHQPDNHGPDRCGDPECFTSCVVDGCDWPCATAWLLDQLDQAEHRIARLEAQSAIRGRAVVMYRERAREAEAERDWNIRSSRLAKEERIKANARAESAEARIRDLTQEVRDERGAALDALEQIKVRDARIKAVEDALSYADMGETLVTRSRIRRALDGDA